MITAERSGLRVAMIFLIETPVRCLYLSGGGQGGEHDGQWASIESRVRWKMGWVLRPNLAIRKKRLVAHNPRATSTITVTGGDIAVAERRHSCEPVTR